MMITLWEGVGLIRYPLTFSLLAVVILSAWSTGRLLKPGAWGDLRTKAWIDAVLFWGAFAAVAGVLGTLLGFILAAQAIEASAGEVSAALIWGGVKVAMLSSALGLIILCCAALSWFCLNFRWRMLAADDEALEA
jgi:hypothetical protein